MRDETRTYPHEQLVGTSTAAGNVSLSARLDYQIGELEKALVKLKKAKEVLARNPDYEFLADSLRHM